MTVEPRQKAIVGEELRTTSFVLGGGVLFVPLLACANVANLILASGVGRTRGNRRAQRSGAVQAGMARQLLTER